jgi:hypothetical protein
MTGSGDDGGDGSLLVLGSPTGIPEEIRSLDGDVRIRELHDLSEVSGEGRPTVLLLSPDLWDAASSTGLKALPEFITVLSKGDGPRRGAESAGRLLFALEDASDSEGRLRLLRAAARHSAALLSAQRAREGAEKAHADLRELNRIGMALMSERDPDRLLGLILSQARRVTVSDAGSLYLVEEEEEGSPHLRFRLAQNDSLPDIPAPSFTLPLDETSLAGYAATSGEPLVIEDAYELPRDVPYSFNRGFDEEYGYRAKSMLVVPMKDHRERVVGVLQLINRKADPNASIRGRTTPRPMSSPSAPTRSSRWPPWRARRRSRSKTGSSTGALSGCSRGSSRRPSPPSISGTPPRRDTRSGSPLSRATWRKWRTGPPGLPSTAPGSAGSR